MDDTQMTITRLRRRFRELKKAGYDVAVERRTVLGRAGLEKGKSILEIGTGHGIMALTLARRGFMLTTIDTDRSAQKSAHLLLKYHRVQRNVRLRVMDAGHLGFASGAFDCVMAVNFLHHARAPFRCLKEMVRVAAEKVVIVDVNARGARILEKIHAREGHRHERSRIGFTEVSKFFRRAGFKVKTTRSRCQTIIVAWKGGRR